MSFQSKKKKEKKSEREFLDSGRSRGMQGRPGRSSKVSDGWGKEHSPGLFKQHEERNDVRSTHSRCSDVGIKAEQTYTGL